MEVEDFEVCLISSYYFFKYRFFGFVLFEVFLGVGDLFIELLLEECRG